MKKLLKYILCIRFIAKLTINLTLKIHSWSYLLAGLQGLSIEGTHPKHRIMKYHRWFTDHLTKDDVVYDAGCGNGILTEAMAKKCKRIIAVDNNPYLIHEAANRIISKNVLYLEMDITIDHLNSDYSDVSVVVLSNVLEHLKNRVEFLCGMQSVAPKILVRTPAANRSWITVYKHERDIPMLDRQHKIEYDIITLMKEAGEAGYYVSEHDVMWGEIYAVLNRWDF